MGCDRIADHGRVIDTAAKALQVDRHLAQKRQVAGMEAFDLVERCAGEYFRSLNKEGANDQC